MGERLRLLTHQGQVLTLLLAFVHRYPNVIGMDTPNKTADMAAYKAAWKLAHPDSVRASQAKHRRKRKTKAWKAAHKEQVAKLRVWKAEYKRRKRAEAKGLAYAALTPEQQAFADKRRKARAEAARALARRAGRRPA